MKKAVALALVVSAICVTAYVVWWNQRKQKQLFEDIENEVASIHEQQAKALEKQISDLPASCAVYAACSNVVKSQPIDVVYVLDTSGSMTDELEMIKRANQRLKKYFIHVENLRFCSVVLGPVEWESESLLVRGLPDTHPAVWQSCTDYEEFLESLTELPDKIGYKLPFEYSQVDREASYLTVYKAAAGELDLGLRLDAKHLFILFTDESDVTPMEPALAEALMCSEIVGTNFLVVMTPHELWDDFAACASVSDLSSDEVYTAVKICNELNAL